MLRRGDLSSLCAVLLFIGACPKRQTMRGTVVYVPAKPPAVMQSSTEQAVLVIAEPEPPPEPEPEPEENAPPPATQPPTRHRASGPAHTKTPVEPDDETAPVEAPETPPAEVPALEPQESSAQQTELRGQFDKLEQEVQQRLTKLNGAQLSDSDRKMVDDARTFFVQATHAMATGDLPRALNLARKASLLLAAVQ